MYSENYWYWYLKYPVVIYSFCADLKDIFNTYCHDFSETHCIYCWRCCFIYIKWSLMLGKGWTTPHFCHLYKNLFLSSPSCSEFLGVRCRCSGRCWFSWDPTSLADHRVYFVTCQAHPVLVKIGESNVRFVLLKFLSRWLLNLLIFKGLMCIQSPTVSA